jgi:excinuclease ABC subunit A
MWRFEEHAIAIWSPTIRNRKGTHVDLFKGLIEQGYLEGKINGREAKFENPPALEKNLRHDIDVRIDRLKLNRANRQRLTEAIEAGLRLGGGTIAIESLKKNKSNIRNEEAEKTEKGQKCRLEYFLSIIHSGPVLIVKD